MERLWEKIEKHESGHWLWHGSLNNRGYGMVQDRARASSPQLAHRLSWEIANGPIVADGLHVLHACDTPACVRPSHLFLGTNTDNVIDKMAKGRQARGDKIGTAVLTAEKVVIARRLHASGWSHERIAAHLGGACRGAYSKAIRRTTWKHVE